MQEFKPGNLFAELFAVELLMESAIGEIGSESRQRLLSVVRSLDETCQQNELIFSSMAVARLVRVLVEEEQISRRNRAELRGVRKRIVDELTVGRFLQMAADKAKFYSSEKLFAQLGELVERRFAPVRSDIEEAGKCFAMDRYTACVFHLMRVMGFGLQEFGKKLRVKLVKDKVWQRILDQVNAAIASMPRTTSRQKRRRSAYAAIASHLFNVKIAWRNEVMHPKASYNGDEAEEVLTHVKSFIRYLAANLENKPILDQETPRLTSTGPIPDPPALD